MNKKPAPLGSDDESWFIDNMKTLRERKGWSQGELARNVAALGWDAFHQTTISRIEKGERPVRLAEARGIAAALDSSVAQMTSPPSGLAAQIYELQRLSQDMATAAGDLHKAAEKYNKVRSKAQLQLDFAAMRVESGKVVSSLKSTLDDEIRRLRAVVEMDAVDLLDWVEDRKWEQETGLDAETDLS